MKGLKEFTIALTQILIGMIILIEVIVVSVFINYMSTIGGIYEDRITESYANSYNIGYAQTYDTSYQTAYADAYDSGYSQGYEIGLEVTAKEDVDRIARTANMTYGEMREFLVNDKTDALPRVSGEYVCSDFAAEVNKNAEANGIRTAYVRIGAESWTHVIVAFETVDQGLVFIEPQTDGRIELIIGKTYPWHMLGNVSTLTSYDPITEIQIIW